MSSTHNLSGAMQDGRFFTDYKASHITNCEMAKKQNISTWKSTNYRHYLQQNGLKELSQLQGVCGRYDCTDYGMSIQPTNSLPLVPYTDDPEIS